MYDGRRTSKGERSENFVLCSIWGGGSHHQASTTLSTTINVAGNGHLWSSADPYLYHVVVVVSTTSTVLDSMDTWHGLRTLLYDANKGFFLNSAMCIF